VENCQRICDRRCAGGQLSSPSKIGRRCPPPAPPQVKTPRRRVSSIHQNKSERKKERKQNVKYTFRFESIRSISRGGGVGPEGHQRASGPRPAPSRAPQTVVDLTRLLLCPYIYVNNSGRLDDGPGGDERILDDDQDPVLDDHAPVLFCSSQSHRLYIM
jgi:hypothetical protein